MAWQRRKIKDKIDEQKERNMKRWNGWTIRGDLWRDDLTLRCSCRLSEDEHFLLQMVHTNFLRALPMHTHRSYITWAVGHILMAWGDANGDTASVWTVFQINIRKSLNKSVPGSAWSTSPRQKQKQLYLTGVKGQLTCSKWIQDPSITVLEALIF